MMSTVEQATNRVAALAVTRVAPPSAAEFTFVLQAVRTAQKRHHIFPLPDTAGVASPTPVPVVVGVSGGADSLCLLHALAVLAEEWQLSLHVAHLDHALRANSGDDAALVRATATHLGLPYYEDRLPVDGLARDPTGIEAAARRARYIFLGQVARQVAQHSTKPVTIAIGHHQDDQAETLLMHLIGGSGLEGLAGMRWVAPLPYHQHEAFRLARPLLGVDRVQIHTALRALGVTWHDDPTNTDTTRLRNQIRHAILPQLAQANPNIAATLARSAGLLAAEADRAATCNDVALNNVQLEQSGQRIVIDLDQLLTLDQATQRGVLYTALERLDIDRRSVGADTIDAILHRGAQPASGGPYPLVSSWCWTLLGAEKEGARRLSLHTAHSLPLTPEQPLLPPGARHVLPTVGTLDTDSGWHLSTRLMSLTDLPDDWRDPDTVWRAYLDADQAAALILTTVQSGMRLAPLGLNGHHRAVGDLLTDHKVAPALRTRWPVITRLAQGTMDTADVAWVCGIRMSHTFRVRPTTTEIRVLEWTCAEDAMPARAAERQEATA